MKRLTLQHFIIIGCLFWGLPATIVAGPVAVLLTIATIVPVWLFSRGSNATTSMPEDRASAVWIPLVIFSLAYIAVDAALGRQLLQTNMFLHGNDAVETFVYEAKTRMSEGRGVAELIGTCIAIMPFALIDTTERTSRVGKLLLWVVAFGFIFYQAGIGRGYLLMAVFALALRKNASWRRVAVAGGLALLAFVVASFVRGDFSTAQLSNPLFDGIAFPFINLSVLLHTNCGSAHSYDFLSEFLKKFVPAFIFPKTIFSFNIEITSCIYPFLSGDTESISIFTYLGEFFYYQPALVTAILAGGIMGFLSRIVDRLLVRYDLRSARLFAGLMCIVLLRSRSQDVMSFLIAQLLFLLLWTLFLSASTGVHQMLAINAKDRSYRLRSLGKRTKGPLPNDA